MASQIVFDDGGGPNVGSQDNGSLAAINVSNFSDAGVLGWFWELVDRPQGSASTLTSTTTASPSFTPDVRGTYLVRLTTYTDASRQTVDDTDEQVYAIRLEGDYPWRVPAAGETSQLDTDRGWAAAREEAIRDIHAFMTSNGSGSEGALVFEWNKTDTSQFESVSAFFDASSGTEGSLSVVASSEFGNVLRYTNAGVTAEMYEVILAVDPLSFSSERRDIVIEMDILDYTGGSSVSHLGVAFLCDDSGANFHGIIHAASANSNRNQALINDGTPETSTAFGAVCDRYTKYTVRGAKPSGGPPYVESRVEGYNDSSLHTDGGIRRTGSSSAARGSVRPFGDGSSTLGSSWNGLACDRWGIGIMTQAGGSPNTTFDILNIKVFVK